MVLLDYRDARPIYTQIVDGFREQILSGILREGERLPSVRELAAELTINPNTIQRAYRELEAAGWIVTVPGKGCFVCSKPEQPDMADRQDLLNEFDRITAALIASGVSREDLAQILLQGGNDHA
jgi:GntR family transcriptional regulator